MTRLGDDLMLCNVAVASLPLEEVIPAAGAAGFTSISVLARAHRRAVTRAGLTDADLAELLADYGLVVRDVEASGDWLEAPGPAAEEWLNSVYDTDQLLDLAEALGATTLVAVHFGPPAPLDAAAGAFARLCDRSAERGLRVALEFPAIATINDVVTAWSVVLEADRPNGGILFDLWHHRRSGATDADLDEVPADRIFSVQLSDGAREPVGALLDDIQHRMLPGEGELGAVDMVRHLDERGVRCPLGIEVFNRDIVSTGAVVAARTLHDSLAAVVQQARS